MYLDVHDSLFNEQSDNRIKDLQIKYETDKKENENLLLKKQIEIETLKGAKRKNLMYFFISSSLLLLGLVLLIFNRYSVKQKLSNQLTEKNNILLETNQKLIESEQNLKDEIYTKDKFFSIIAHDLKSPLSSLTIVSEMLNENLDVISIEQLKYYLNSISHSTANLFDLVENLLNWARAQSGKITINLQKIDITELVSKQIELLKVFADNKNISITNQIKNSNFAMADINLLTLVFRNLLVNAIKFTNQNGKIEVSVVENEQNVIIAVKDNGIGIAKEDLGKLFRIDIDTKKIGNSNSKGTGLGLILCKEFIEKQNGKIWIESNLEQGSTFYFSLLKS